jgi:hypothetical protein
MDDVFLECLGCICVVVLSDRRPSQVGSHRDLCPWFVPAWTWANLAFPGRACHGDGGDCSSPRHRTVSRAMGCSDKGCAHLFRGCRSLAGHCSLDPKPPQLAASSQTCAIVILPKGCMPRPSRHLGLHRRPSHLRPVHPQRSAASAKSPVVPCLRPPLRGRHRGKPRAPRPRPRRAPAGLPLRKMCRTTPARARFARIVPPFCHAWA